MDFEGCQGWLHAVTLNGQKKIMKAMIGSLIIAYTFFAANFSRAADLNVVEVPSTDVNCLFNVNCTNIVEQTSSPIILSNAVGTGLLTTRVVTGEPGSGAEGLFGYVYQIDLSGVVNPFPCFSNVVRCTTNRIINVTNVVICRTNTVGSNIMVCVTNHLPATNLVLCLTNALPGTNVVNCAPGPNGQLICVTNTFGASNVVLCITNRIPARDIVSCQATQLMASNVVQCLTNRAIVCTTNLVPCPGSAACIESLRIDFGAIVSFEFAAATQQVFVVSNGFGSIAPATATQTNRAITVNFDPPICAGDRSFFVGLLSSNAPVDIRVGLGLTGGRTLFLASQGPGRRGRVIDCDFRSLLRAFENLESSDIVGPNANARKGRHNALLNHVRNAGDAARAGDVGGLLHALSGINKKLDWLTPQAERRISSLLDDLLRCLEGSVNGGPGDDDDDDDDDNHDDHNDDDHDQAPGRGNNGHHGGRGN
jgi:hypothetical protein